MKILNRLWNDEAGFIVSSELILLSAIVVMGILVGMQTVREAVIGELADAAIALSSINQSYSFSGVTGHSSSVAGSVYVDTADWCDMLNTASTSGFDGCIASGIAATATVF